MKFNKYNIPRNGETITSSSSDSNDSTSRGSSSSNDINSGRTLWGNQDDGSSIDDSMRVEGNLYLKAYDASSENSSRADGEEDDGEENREEDDDTTDEVFPPEDEELNGSIYADGGVYSSSVESNEIYAKQHLFVPHPTTKEKTDINDLLVDYDTRINKNTTDIKTLSDKVALIKSCTCNGTNNGTSNGRVIIDDKVEWWKRRCGLTPCGGED